MKRIFEQTTKTYELEHTDAYLDKIKDSIKEIQFSYLLGPNSVMR
jgi:hypothetical protein